MAIIGGAALWLLLTALPATGRPGYSADEEVTALVISSSSSAGVPRLPSGVVYLRGALYVKLSDVAGALLSHDLQAYRLVSLMFGLANVLLIAVVAKAWLPPPAAPVAAVLLAVSPLHAAASVFARPYTAAVFCLLAGCLVMRRALDGSRREWTFLVLALVSQTVHESAVLFAILPLAYGMVQEKQDVRRRAWWLGAKTAAIAALVQGLWGAWFSASLSSVLGSVDRPMAVFVLRSIPWPPFDLPVLARGPGIGAAVILFAALATVLRRATGLRPLELFTGACLGGLFLLGPLAAATVLMAIARPRRARATLAAGGAIGLTSAVFW
ncbi:MAG: glycosyltransferase family 39 protein, partial [Vicinamibacterales bacterium]